MTSDSSVATVTVLYFAQLSEQLGCRSETVALPPEVVTVTALREYLLSRGGAWTALANDNLRSAVNQKVVKGPAPVTAGDEVAFFPPVTGG